MAALRARDIAAGDGCGYYIMPFGKYQGQTLGQILSVNPAYIYWLDTKCTLTSGPFAQAVREIATKYVDRLDFAGKFKRAKKL